MLQDVAPDGVRELMSEVSITLEPDIEASTPASPLFSEPIYILDIKEVRYVKRKRVYEINQDSIVSTATFYGLHSLGIESWWG